MPYHHIKFRTYALTVGTLVHYITRDLLIRVVRRVKYRWLRWAGHVGKKGETRNAYRVLVGRTVSKYLLENEHLENQEYERITLRSTLGKVCGNGKWM